MLSSQMFLFIVFLFARATELEFFIDQHIAEQKAKIRWLERENLYLLAENDDLRIKNKILEKKVRYARERIDEMEYLAERAMMEKRGKLEEISNEEIIIEINAYKDNNKNNKLNENKMEGQIFKGKLQSWNRMKHSSPTDLDYFLENLKIGEDWSFQSPDSRSWMRISNYDKFQIILSNAEENQQKVTFHMNVPVKLKIKNPEMGKLLWLSGEIFELHSIGSFAFGVENELQNSFQKQVSMMFVSLRTGTHVLFHYGKKYNLKDYTLYAKDKPVGIILASFGQYGERMDNLFLKIGDVSVMYMENEKFVQTVKYKLRNHSKK